MTFVDYLVLALLLVGALVLYLVIGFLVHKFYVADDTESGITEKISAIVTALISWPAAAWKQRSANKAAIRASKTPK